MKAGTLSVSLEHGLEKYNFNSIDVFKLCMAFVVVAIHSNLESSINCEYARQILELIYNIAVPYFFMTSGFLLFRGQQFPLNLNGRIRVHKYLYRIGKMYLIWTLCYLPFTIWGFITDDISAFNSVIIFIRNFLLVGENFYSWPLWYLLALIVAVMLILVCSFFKLTRYHVLIISIIFFLLGIGIDYCNQNGLIPQLMDLYFKLFKSTRNGFFIGFIYVVLGMQIACTGRIVRNGILLGGLFLGILLSFFYPSIGSVLITYFLFQLILKMPMKFLREKYCIHLRIMSTIIYLVHMYWVVLWGYVLQENGYKVYILSLFSSILLSLILLKYKDRYWFRSCF